MTGSGLAIRLGAPGTQTRAFVAGVSGNTTGAAPVSVLVDATGELGTIASARRYKEEIRPMADASAGLHRLRPVTFRYRQPRTDGTRPLQYGLIAEEVAEVYPELVVHTAAGEIETVRYHVLPALLLNGVQRQQRTIEAQAARLAELVERLERLEDRLRD